MRNAADFARACGIRAVDPTRCRARRQERRRRLHRHAAIGGRRRPLILSVPMPSDPEPLEAAISALEAQRALLGDAVVDASVAALRAKLDAQAPAPAAATLPTQ